MGGKMNEKISRRNFMKSAFGSMAAITALPLAGCYKQKQPNILFIAVDDLRTELNCYGKTHVISPNIDRLAQEGFVAERAFCNVPVCGASRASLLTGARPTRDRFVTYYTWAEKDYPHCITLPKFFKDRGYYAISNGKVFHHQTDYKNHWSEEPWRPQGGWRDYILDENKEHNMNGDGRPAAYEIADVADNEYFDGQIADKTINDLRELKRKKNPFFLAVGFRKPHLPFNAPLKYWNFYDRNKLPMADNNFRPQNAPDAAMHNWGELRAYRDIPLTGPVSEEMAKTLVHGYNACVSYTDAQIGKLLDELENLDLNNNTIIVLWGDHGWNLQEHTLWCKHCNFETSLQAPLIVKAPGHKPVRSSGLIEFIDIYPTLCELSGYKVPGHCAGKSFYPLIANPDKEWKEAIFSRYHDGQSVRTERYLYTEWKDDNGKKYARMLYDHKNDPDENINIAELPENKELVEKLSFLLNKKES